MTALRLLFIILLAQICAISAHTQEAIQSFDVAIVAEQDGDLLVSETLTVKVEGQQIRRGILRELPRYQLYQGEEIPVRYKIKSIGRNNDKEPFVIEREGNAFVLRIGDADEYLRHTSHTYEISYLIKDELRRFDSHDEIYWNVTGNYWRLPINSVSASISVPYDATFQAMDLFTGSRGATGEDANFQNRHPKYEFQTNRPFREGEGLTVSLRFDKGTFGGVQASTKRYVWWLRYGALILLSLAFMGIAAYYYLSWNRVGRDPAKGAVFPIYEPPGVYSPAAASYIYYRGIKDHKALTATLMGLATKNWISIDTDKRKTVLTPLDREVEETDDPNLFDMTWNGFKALITGNTKKLKQEGLEAYLEDDDIELPDDSIAVRGNLYGEENHIFRRFFPRSHLSPIILKKEPNTHFNLGYAAFQRSLKRDYGEPYYKVNLGYIMAGIFLSGAALFITLSQLSKLTPNWIFGLIAALILLNLLFIYLMPAPTKKGQRVRTELEGFRLYMKTAEKIKMDAVEVGSDALPPMSVKRYETLLPYAIALGVEGPWSQYFEKVMPVEAENYEPHWGGSVSDFGGISQMTDHMVDSISSGVSSAAPQSSGSSGGGGGGFSGGGGGGGGGGGW